MSKKLYDFISYPVGKFTESPEFKRALNKVLCCTNSGGGGIQSIVAGTNVTVDNTDPLNPIVSAVGGGVDTTAWHKLGDLATSGDFLGTTNVIPLPFRTNNTEAMRILTNQKVLVGTATDPGAFKFWSESTNLAGIGATSDTNYGGYFTNGTFATTPALFVSRNNTTTSIAEFYGPTASVFLTALGSIQATALSGTGTRMVVADAAGLMSTQAIPGGGGGGTPGGSTTQIQYNDAGIFGADANYTWDKTNKRLKIGAGTKDADLSIISSRPFADGGNIYIESSDVAGAAIVMNTTNGSGRKYIWLNRNTGKMCLYDYGVSMDVAQFDSTAYDTISIKGTNTAGTGITLQSQTAGGDNWLFLSTGSGGIFGAGHLGIFAGGIYRMIIKNGTGQIGINTTSIDDSAILDVTSTTKGFIKPRMTTTQQNAIGTPGTGLEIYNTTLNQTSFYNGTVWAQNWSTRGNNIVSGDYIGTNNAIPLVFKQNGNRVGFIETSSGYQLHSGINAGISNTSNYNTTYGHFALSQVGGGGVNSLFGAYAGEKVTGDGNNLFGFEAGKELVAASWNVAIGCGALRGGAGAVNHNIAIGYQSQYKNNGGSGNISLGLFSLYELTNGTSNIAIGSQAMQNVTTGGQNVVIGIAALSATSPGSNATYNVGVGNGALNITTGNYNTALGYESLKNLTTGSANTSLGAQAAYNTTGDYNIAIGYQALIGNTTGTSNIAIGKQQNCASNTSSNQMNIGGLLFGVNMTGSVGSPAGQLGIGIGTPNASAILDVTSTTKGALLPRMTDAEIRAIPSPANGLLAYNTTLNKLCVYESSTWKQVTTTTM